MTIYANAHTAYGEPLLFPIAIYDDSSTPFIEALIKTNLVDDADDLHELLQGQEWFVLLEDFFRENFPLLVPLSRDGNFEDPDDSGRLVIAIKSTVTSAYEDSAYEDYPVVTGSRDDITVSERKELSDFFTLVTGAPVKGDWLMWLDISL